MVEKVSIIFALSEHRLTSANHVNVYMTYLKLYILQIAVPDYFLMSMLPNTFFSFLSTWSNLMYMDFKTICTSDS